VAHPGVDRLALLRRQLQRSQPLPSLDAEHVRERRLGLQPALKHARTSFLDRERERTSCSRRASRRRKNSAALIGHPHRLKLTAHKSSANARASSLSVFALALAIPVSSGETTTTRSTCGSRIRATSRQLPVTSSAAWSVGKNSRPTS
jgi:hypothetical protein